ncbi:hypothetical protein ILUMI_25305 [Ignelater luminosus]|uniref:Uncharacterized protein n=1 Tax=Ignelater luminosus TaxID=2038154 RepID=A0A8K0C8N5_IGNLU|nr:hypothetical protein ILUMI_25305 [Ignelater luminosus]
MKPLNSLARKWRKTRNSIEDYTSNYVIVSKVKDFNILRDILTQDELDYAIAEVNNQQTGRTDVRNSCKYKRLTELLAGHTKKKLIKGRLQFSVNGGWSQWSSWTECRCPGSTLATGQKRTRSCNSPPPSNGGLQCQGVSVQRTKDCQTCPQAEPPRWSAWSEWSECNADCTRTRRRQCISPSGQTRRQCLGKDLQTAPCSSELCPSTQLAGIREALSYLEF